MIIDFTKALAIGRRLKEQYIANIDFENAANTRDFQNHLETRTDDVRKDKLELKSGDILKILSTGNFPKAAFYILSQASTELQSSDIQAVLDELFASSDVIDAMARYDLVNIALGKCKAPCDAMSGKRLFGTGLFNLTPIDPDLEPPETHFTQGNLYFIHPRNYVWGMSEQVRKLVLETAPKDWRFNWQFKFEEGKLSSIY